MKHLSVRNAALLIIVLTLIGSTVSFIYAGHTVSSAVVIGNLLRLGIVALALHIFMGQHPR